MTTQVMTGFNRVQMQGSAAAACFPQPKFAEWLPAPPARTQVPLQRPRPACRGRKHVKSIWVPPVRESLFEKACMVALVGGAAVGIAYGFSLLIDLVENWAVFQASVSQTLQ
jgi:hypothetical protein